MMTNGPIEEPHLVKQAHDSCLTKMGCTLFSEYFDQEPASSTGENDDNYIFIQLEKDHQCQLDGRQQPTCLRGRWGDSYEHLHVDPAIMFGDNNSLTCGSAPWHYRDLHVEKIVRFSTVQIREYSITVTEDPNRYRGYSVELDWEYSKSEPLYDAVVYKTIAKCQEDHLGSMYRQIDSHLRLKKFDERHVNMVLLEKTNAIREQLHRYLEKRERIEKSQS